MIMPSTSVSDLLVSPVTTITETPMPWVKGNPTLSVDKTVASSSDTVTFNWSSNGGAGCYASVDGNKTTDLSGSGYAGTIKLKDIPAGKYSAKISCNFDTLRESTPVTVNIHEPYGLDVMCNLPTIRADKSTVKVGETVTFTWDAANR